MRIKDNCKGFTLIELFVVMVLLFIMAFLAIMHYTVYKANAFDARANAALRLVATAEEAYYVSEEVYKTCDELTCHAVLGNMKPLEDGITLQVSATANGFIARAIHDKGTGEIFYWQN